MTTERLQSGDNGECLHNTLTRAEADSTSLLEVKTTTELCHQKCRRIQASISHSQAQAGIVIYIMVVGGGRRQSGMVILCSASAVSYRVAVIRKITKI